MKATENGTPKQCAENILSIRRGENPMERVKGIDTRFVDKLEQEAETDIKEDVKWLLDTYEPRVNVEDVEIGITEQIDGNHRVFAVIADA